MPSSKKKNSDGITVTGYEIELVAELMVKFEISRFKNLALWSNTCVNQLT